MKDFKTKNGFFTGNVGVGTTNPSAKLDVQTSGHPLYIRSGSGANDNLFLFENPSSGPQLRIYEKGTSNIKVKISTHNESFFNGGNVGIGTTSPIAKLNIANTTADSNIFTISRAESAAVSLFSIFQDSSWDIGGGQGSGIAHINTNNRNLAITTSSDQSLDGGIFINESGNVGIGATNPSTKLDVVDNDNSIQLSVRGRSSDSFGIIDFKNNQGTASKGMIKSDASSNLMFRAGPTTDVLTMTPSGDVGVGTTNPTSFTGFMGSSAIATTINSNNGVVLNLQRGTDVNNAGIGAMQFLNTNNSSDTGMGSGSQLLGLISIQNVTSDGNTSSDAGGNLRLYTKQEAGSCLERMRITSAGNVGIGTTNPSCRMNVQALSSAPWALCINRADSSGANSGRVFFDSSAGAWCIVNENGNFQLRWNGTPGTSSGTAKLEVVANANAWTAVSDERLKENISEISNALDIIKDKRCSRFNYVDDSEKRKTVGFIAQDWVDDLPEIVNASKGLDVDDENDTDEYLGLEYQGVIPVLTKAIQEQQTMIEDLKARIETLES
jgi:hypothetical protein